MNTYTIIKASPTLDWSAIPSLAINLPYLDTPADIRASAQICYTENEFLVHLSTAERDPRAEEVSPTGLPYLDSCLEFFFCPMENDSRYFNFEYNPNGCLFLGFGHALPNRFRLLPNEPIDTLFCPVIHRTADGWEIFYRIPFSFIRQFFPDFAVFSGKQMRANCYKCADLSDPPHYLSWSPIEGDVLSFHRPHCFGTMVLA